MSLSQPARVDPANPQSKRTFEFRTSRWVARWRATRLVAAGFFSLYAVAWLARAAGAQLTGAVAAALAGSAVTMAVGCGWHLGLWVETQCRTAQAHERRATASCSTPESLRPGEPRLLWVFGRLAIDNGRFTLRGQREQLDLSSCPFTMERFFLLSNDGSFLVQEGDLIELVGVGHLDSGGSPYRRGGRLALVFDPAERLDVYISRSSSPILGRRCSTPAYEEHGHVHADL